MEFKCAHCLELRGSPKLLSCFHVFCDDCLSKRVVMDSQGGCSSLSCPICHLVSFIAADGIGGLPTISTSYCREHDPQMQYCYSCEVVFCCVCAGEQHQDHTSCQISEVFSAHRSEIEAKLIPLHDRLVSVSKLVSQVESQLTAVSAKEEVVESGIVNMVGMIEEALQSRKADLCEELHATTRERLKYLSSRKHQMTILQAQVSSCLGFIKEALRLGREEEMVRMRSILLQHIDTLLNGEHEIDLSDPEGDFCLKLRASPQDLAEKCLGFGKIITQNSPIPSPATLCSPAKKPSPAPEVSKMLVRRLGTPLLILKDLEGPCGIAVSESGDVIVAEGCADRVSVFNSSGEKIRSFGQCGAGEGDFTCPCEVDVDGEGNILVVDGSNRRVQKFTSDGKFLASVGRSGVGVLQFLEPDGIAVHPTTGWVYVVDNNTHRIQILNPDFTFFKMFGKEGNGSGYLRYPWGIACSCDGEVYVTDSGNCCVQVFSEEGQFLREFGRMGMGEGELMWPTGISVSADGYVVYVSDYGNHRVSVFSSDGLFLKIIGNKGKRCGDFGNIRGINVDRNGLVYVCDTDNNRVILY